MPSRSTNRATSNVRTQILGDLKEDHKRVKKAYRDFQKLDAQEDPESCEALVLQVLDELSMHAAIEEELLYPAAREAIADEHLIDEAEVEHESMHALIDQLRQMSPDDDKYAARFTVLCEYVLHHVKEEEGEMFPQLERARLDWESLATEMNERRAEMSGGQAAADDEASDQDEDGQTEDADETVGTKATARGTDRSA